MGERYGVYACECAGRRPLEAQGVPVDLPHVAEGEGAAWGRQGRVRQGGHTDVGGLHGVRPHRDVVPATLQGEGRGVNILPDQSSTSAELTL